MNKLMEKIGYQYKNPELLEDALLHSSYANEGKHPRQSNERLEFLGDSVLSIVVSEYLYNNHPEMPEGELTKLRARLVCEKSLAKYAVQLGLPAAIKLGKGEEKGGGRERPSINADAFEAVIASLYLDGGMAPAKEFVLHYVLPDLEEDEEPSFDDYKTQLQEIIQQNPEERVQYVLTEESGPDHDKRFTVEVHLNSNVIGEGTGRSKKEAEQRAAREALLLMGETLTREKE